MHYADSHADPELYPRPDGTVYICGEAETVDVPDNPADIEPRKSAVQALQVVEPLSHCTLPYLSTILLYYLSQLSNVPYPHKTCHLYRVFAGGGRSHIELTSSRQSAERASLLFTPLSRRDSCHWACTWNCPDPVCCQWYVAPSLSPKNLFHAISCLLNQSKEPTFLRAEARLECTQCKMCVRPVSLKHMAY